MPTKSNKPEDMLLRVIRVAELLAKGADTTADNGQQCLQVALADHEQKTQAKHFPVS